MGDTTGGATIARMLEREDVAAFFGIVDGTYTQLFAHLVERGLTMFSPRHESIAVHMAGAYARMTGRLGVVHLDVPEDLINGSASEPMLPRPDQYRRSTALEPAGADVQRAAELLARARLPMIHAGSGVIHALAFGELAQLAERLHAPVTTSWGARGVFSERSPLAWPMVHVEACTQLRNAADLVLCVGSDVGETDWWGKPPYWAPPARQRWIQVDVDERVLGRNRPVELAVLADARCFLARLLDAVKQAGPPPEAQRAQVAALAEQKRSDRAALDAALAKRAAPMLTAHVGAACRAAFPDDAIFVFDGGNTSVWGQFYTELRRPNTQLSTAHMGHLGAGVGQALGAAVAHPGRPVCCIIGDGAMAFQMQEIETAVRHGLAPVFVVCCDRQWGMVKINQKVALGPVKQGFARALGPDHEGTINTDLGEIAWDRVAEAMGAHGERVAHPDQLGPALERCLASRRCAVLHVDVDRDAHLLAPGLLHFKAMHQEPVGT